MHPLEQRLAETLARGDEPTLEQFPLPELVAAAQELGKSRMFSEFLRFALAALKSSEESERALLGEFVALCVESASDDMGWIEALDLLDQHRPLPPRIEERCFTRFLEISADPAEPPLTRAVGLDGALRWAIPNRRRQLRLLDTLLGIEKSDNDIFLSRAAKIIGIAYCHWREQGLLDLLRAFSSIPNVGDEAAFELGMAELARGLEASDRTSAVSSFAAARNWFQLSSQARESRPDADAYIDCLNLLTGFSTGKPTSELRPTLSSLLQNDFIITAWHRSAADPPWLGARHTEQASWTILSIRLTNLSHHLDQTSWYEPVAVIEECLLAAYAANRTILQRSSSGGIASLVRPRIERALHEKEAQAYVLKEWVRRHPEHVAVDEAQELLRNIDALVEERSPSPKAAATVWPDLAAVLKKAGIPSDARLKALEVIWSAQAVHLGNLSDSEVFLIEQVTDAVAGTTDYSSSSVGRGLFDAVLLGSLRFLHSRLEMTRRDEPRMAYLFETEDGSLPLEGDLQQDYFQFMYGLLPGVETEISNIGSGRVDVRFSYGGERIITEVKRESDDCSFENLCQIYGGQSSDYQNVSLRLGFLLVLDQCEVRKHGSPHIRDLVRVGTVVRTGEAEPRKLIIIKVPGRRYVPSELSKLAKADLRKTKSQKRRGP